MMTNGITKILGIKISDLSLESILEEVRKWLKNGERKHYIVTPNSEILVHAQKNKEFAKILDDADLALPDGIGVVLASKFLGREISERITGVDFMKNLCQIAQKEGFTIGLIGGGPAIAVKARECLLKMYPRLRIVLAQEEWDGDFKNTQIDILFVAFGAPRQEIWISKNLKKLPVKVAIGVGGAFDYLSGRVPRAPKWVQNLGFEWLFRLIRQPWRIKRQLALLKFVWLVVRERLKIGI